MFSGCRLKGRDKESISLHHDAFSITYSGAVNPDHSLSLPAFSTAMLFFSLLILTLGLFVFVFSESRFLQWNFRVIFHIVCKLS